MWLDISYLSDALDGDGHIDFNVDLHHFDLNHDGVINADDCPFPDGSTEAKLWWRNVMEPYTKSQLQQEWTSEHGDAVVGGYAGKPLIPGQNIPGTGDFQFLVDKLRITQGLSYSSAIKVAGKIKGFSL